MAQRKRAKKQGKPAQAKRKPREGSMVLGQHNVLLLVAGIIVIIVGYLLLGRGSITAAPLLLVAGYCIMVPLAIVLWVRRPEEKRPQDKESRAGE